MMPLAHERGDFVDGAGTCSALRAAATIWSMLAKRTGAGVSAVWTAEGTE
jgi:hypothetical protein